MGCCEVEADTFPTKKVLSEIQYSKKNIYKNVIFSCWSYFGWSGHTYFVSFFFGGGGGGDILRWICWQGGLDFDSCKTSRVWSQKSRLDSDGSHQKAQMLVLVDVFNNAVSQKQIRKKKHTINEIIVFRNWHFNGELQPVDIAPVHQKSQLQGWNISELNGIMSLRDIEKISRVLSGHCWWEKLTGHRWSVD